MRRRHGERHVLTDLCVINPARVVGHPSKGFVEGLAGIAHGPWSTIYPWNLWGYILSLKPNPKPRLGELPDSLQSREKGSSFPTLLKVMGLSLKVPIARLFGFE